MLLWCSKISNIEKYLEEVCKIQEINLNRPILCEEAEYYEERFKRTYRRDEAVRYILTMLKKEEVDFL